MRYRTLAPAKINWTLEVLGKRPDGYHELRSVIQTIDICDELTIAPSAELTLAVRGQHDAGEDDLVLRVSRDLLEGSARDGGAEFILAKHIPVGAGLGGGSSDAAGAIRLLSARPGRRLVPEARAEIAARVSSDAPFFCYGGTALASGRGETVEPLPDARRTWLVVLAPPITVEGKTRRMYAALDPGAFTDGSRSAAFAEALLRGAAPMGGALYNVFESAAFGMFPGLDGYRGRMLEAGATTVHLAGSGPALYTLAASREDAHALADSIRRSSVAARVFVARTLTAAEATRIDRVD